ncbi:MAG TPA: Rv3235 family protein [Mycobacterium sp.]|nr:Rv3235 family protein [Mycobacterium sp.]
MTVDPIPRGTLAVLPVIDYEPPARAVPHRRPLSPGRRHAAASPSGRPPPAVLPATLRTVATFADTALRRVLEVVDQRRPAAHLHPLLAPGLVESVLSGRAAATGCGGAALLQRVRVQAAGPDDPPTAVEVFGSYRRGRRIHAVAGRVERAPAGAGLGWQLVALHIG